MDKKELKILLNQIIEGKIPEVKYYVDKHAHTIVDSEILLNILITVNKSIYLPELGDKISSESWCELIILCCKNITYLNEKKNDSYLRAMFFISKYFIEKNSFKCLINILNFITPNWIINNRDFITIYSHFIFLFDNVIATQSRSINGVDLIRICLVATRLHTFGQEKNPVVIFSRIAAYCSIIRQNQSINETQRYEFNLQLLDIISSVPYVKHKEVTNEVYRTFISMINLMLVKNSFEDESYLLSIMTRSIEIIKKLCVAKEYLEHAKLLQEIFCVLVKILKKYAAEDVLILSKLTTKLSVLCEDHGLSSVTSRTVIELSRFLWILLEYLESLDGVVLTSVLQVSFQMELMCLIRIVGNYISQCESNCNCCAECQCKCDYVQAITVLKFSGSLVNMSVLQNIMDIDRLQDNCLKCLRQCCEYVEKIKTAKCEKWIINWQFIGSFIYNIGSRLYKIKNYELAQHFYHLFIEKMVLLEGTENTNICLENGLGNCLHLYSMCLFSLKNYRKSFTYLSLLMYIQPTFRLKALDMWVTIKSRYSENDADISKFNVSSVLKQNEEELSLLCPTYKYNKNDVANLLFHEMDFYMNNWPSKVPLNSAFKEFCNLSNDALLRTKISAIIWEKVVNLHDDEFVVNIDKTMQLFNNDKRNEYDVYTKKICMSILHFLKYNIKSIETLRSNTDDMIKANILNKDEEKPYEELPHPNDKCDIIPAYINTKIENKLVLYKMLNKTVNLWEEVFNISLPHNVLELMKELKIDNFIKQVAFEYRLQQFCYQMLKTWNSYLKYGRVMQNNIIIVTAFGFLIEYADCHNASVISMMNEAENLINNLETVETLESQNCIITYYINKSTGLMNSHLDEEGYNALCVAENYKQKFSNVDCKILEARMLKLKSSYLLYPCNEKYFNHEDNFIVFGQNAFVTLADFYKEGGSKCAYTLSILLEIALSNGWIYKWLRMSREVRSYTKDSVLLAQKIISPLFTAQFLILLAFTDLLDGQYDDCHVKLNGLINILGLGSNVKMSLPDKEEFILNSASLSTKMEKLNLTDNEQSFETMLDIPCNIKSISQGSPILQSKSYKLPHFAQHHNECDCYYCLNLGYQKIVLETVHLEAQLYKSQLNLELAYDYFSGALTLYTQMRNKCSYSLASISESVIDSKTYNIFMLQFCSELSFAYCKLLLDFSYYFVQKNNITCAEQILKDISACMENKKVMNSYFLQEIMSQKLNLSLCKIQIETLKKNENLSNNLRVDYKTVISKTPDDKVSVTKISVSVSPCTTPPKKTARSIKFNLSDAEDEMEEYKDTHKANIVSNFHLKTPAKTPGKISSGRSTVKIYTPATIKLNKGMAQKVPNTPNILYKNSNMTSSITKSKAKKYLEKRSKLLTEKLKAEKEMKSVLNEDDQQKEYAQSRTICKNLLDELDDELDNETVQTALPDSNTKNIKANSSQNITQPSKSNIDSSIPRRSARNLKKI